MKTRGLRATGTPKPMKSSGCHFNHAHSHEYQVRHHPLAMRGPGRLDHIMSGRIAIREFAMLVNIDIVQRPHVLECRACGLRADGSLVRAIGIERRVHVDQIHTIGIHPAHDDQVVARPDCLVGEVHLCFPCVAEGRFRKVGRWISPSF